MKKLLIITTILLSIAAQVRAVPSQITYQGTLKEKGVPANGTKNMKFEILNGGQSIWTKQQIVEVKNGLFSVMLNPTGVDWEHITPSLQITIENQLLSPSEPITANVYSLVANAVVDGAVTVQKLSPAVQGKLIPTGMISMFATACPPGWTRFTALDNAFPYGGSSYGLTGGNANVALSISQLPVHTHTIMVNDPGHSHSLTPSGASGVVAVQNSGPNQGLTGGGSGGGSWSMTSTQGATAGITATASSTGSGSSINILPPYITVIWCQKN